MTLATYDSPIADDPFTDTRKTKGLYECVHIRNQQRNGRKTVTTIQGLNENLDIKLICRALRKTFSCNGTVIQNEPLGKIIQLQGDQRANAAGFLISQDIVNKDSVKIHGA